MSGLPLNENTTMGCLHIPGFLPGSAGGISFRDERGSGIRFLRLLYHQSVRAAIMQFAIIDIGFLARSLASFSYAGYFFFRSLSD